jgi:hypothetical protein
VNRACSWLYCVIKNILSKKSWLGFSPSLGFSQDKSLCLLVLVYLLLDPAYIFSIWLLNVKGRSKYSGKSIATENLRKSNTFLDRSLNKLVSLVV